jgi:tetratricopeptide (TPR) repeat protein
MERPYPHPLIWGMIILGLWMPFMAVAGPPDPPHRALQPGVDLLRDGNEPAAMDFFAQAVAANPSDAEARRYLDIAARGIIQSPKNPSYAPPAEIQAARQRAQTILDKRAQDVRLAMENIRASYETNGRPTRDRLLRTCRGTELQLQMAMDDSPESRLMKEDLQTACSSLEKGDALPTKSEILHVSGYLAFFQGDKIAALEKWNSALKLAPGNHSLKRVILQTDSFLNQQNRRVRIFEKLALGEKKLAAFDEAGARLVYQEVLALDPANLTAREQIALLKRNEARRAAIGQHRRSALGLEKKGDTGKAAQEWVAVLELDPVNAEAIHRLANYRAKLMAPSPRPTSEKGSPRPKDPRRAEERYALGIILYSEGNLPGARQAFEECLVLNPGHEQARRAVERLRQQTP